ncbi:hypothetical protein [Marinobacter daepoensis]|uniref:hypothetical protein n=1 Tax=Marinobacter daepoensis TaxID=262077 RepID=UPI0004A30AF4|nr:hypothetical protein [Marinobacter daepoensis]
MGLTAVVMAGCGGGSSGNSDTDTGQPDRSAAVSGVVTDPEIEGAAVRLVDDRGDALTPIFRTSADGRFVFELTGRQLAEFNEIVAVGGRDSVTGTDLTGITLRAPASEAGDYVVSPVTTLWLEAREELTDDQVAALLGLDSVDMLDDDPADNPEVQALALKITEIVTTLRDLGLSWEDLVSEVQVTNGDFALAAENLAEDAASPLMRVANRIRLLESGIDPEGVSMVERWNLLRIEEGLSAYYRDDLGVILEGEAADAIARIARSVWEGSGRKGVAPNSPGVLNLARYLVTVYGLDVASLAADLVVPAGIASDELVAFVISTDFIDHQLPLAQGERLTDDPAKRAEYFLRSDLSPFYQAEQLFVGVYDDAATDPVYGLIAEGLSAAGLNDEAVLTVRSKIFQPSIKANTFRQLGLAFLQSGANSKAIEQFDRAAAIYLGENGVVASKGALNLSFDDTRSLQNLSTAYRQAGKTSRAEEMLQPVLTIRDGLGGSGKPWSGAYYNITTGIVDLAVELVERAELEGLEGAAYQSALDYTHLAASWVESMPKLDHPLTCAAIQTQYTGKYMDLYSRLGRKAEALAGVGKFENLLALDCNAFSKFYVDIASATYARLGLIERFEDLLASEVEGQGLYDAAAKTSRLELAVFKAVEAAKAGDDLVNAVTVMEREVVDPLDRAHYMTFGIRGLTLDPSPLFERLLNEGLVDAAREVVGEAWALVNSKDYVIAASSPGKLLGEGCLAVVAATDVIGDRNQAAERMDHCAALAASRYGAGSSTRDRIEALTLVATAYVGLGQYPSVALSALMSEIAVVSDPASQLASYVEVANLQATAGRLQEAHNTLMSKAEAALAGLPPVNDVETAKERIRLLLLVANAYADSAVVARHALAAEGVWQPVNRELISQARGRARALISNETGRSSSVPDALTALLVLDQNARIEQRKKLVKTLSDARHYELAELIARDGENSGADTGEMLNVIASALTTQDDYPGTHLARFDFDGDGLADFFAPQSTEAERQHALFELDDDIDNDGIQDALDSTPYCATCG